MLEIQAFHHHLGTNKYVYALLFEQLYQRIMSMFPFYGVNIHSSGPYLGEHLLQFFLDALRTEILLGKVMVTAGLAGGQGWIYGSAIMTDQFVADLMVIK